MRKRRRLLIALAVAVVLAVAGLLVWMRVGAAPEAVRLLPECDAVIYMNLQPVRAATAFSSLPEQRHDPEYEEFVRGSGFQFERDLDQAAFAVHRAGSAENSASETRFSEVFVGRFNYDKLTEYLRQKAQTVGRYRETDVYSIPIEGRTVRVAILSVDMVAVSNVAQASVIEGVIDRARKGGLPFGGPELVRNYRRHLPFGSLAWSIAAVARSGRENLKLPGGFEIPFPPGTTLVGSVRFTGNVSVKVEAFTPKEEDAKNLSENLSLVLTLFRSIQSNLETGGSDPDVKALFDSLEVKQEKNRAILTASIPPGFIKKALQEAPATIAPVEPPATPPKSQRKRR